MKKRSIISVLTLAFVILGLLAACIASIEPDSGSAPDKPGSNYMGIFEVNCRSPIP
jgi:hypothetical protein